MHIKKRGKKYYFVVQVRDEFDNPKSIERVGGTTKAAARLAAEQYLRMNTDYYGTLTEPESMTFKELFDIFMTDYVEVNLKPATVRSYRQIGKNHLLPFLEKVTLRRLNTRLLQKMLNDKRDTLARSTLSSVLSVLSKCISYACNCGIMHENPTKFLILPKTQKVPVPLHVFTREELTTIMDAFPIHHPFFAPIQLAYFTGMRIGECMALKWKDINFDKGTVYIHSTMFDEHGIPTIQPTPKTTHSIRTIPVSDLGMAVLRKIRKYQQEKFLVLGMRWSDDITVCTDDRCRMMTSDRMRFFGQFCKKTFGSGSFHCLRHTHATMLLEAGEDLDVVSKRLGHSSIATTANIYSHMTKGRMERSRDLLNRLQKYEGK